jgi:hypothetical protein
MLNALRAAQWLLGYFALCKVGAAGRERETLVDAKGYGQGAGNSAPLIRNGDQKSCPHLGDVVQDIFNAIAEATDATPLDEIAQLMWRTYADGVITEVQSGWLGSLIDFRRISLRPLAAAGKPATRFASRFYRGPPVGVYPPSSASSGAASSACSAGRVRCLGRWRQAIPKASGLSFVSLRAKSSVMAFAI